MKQKKNDFGLINSLTITNGGTKICIRRFVKALEPKRDRRHKITRRGGGV